MELNQILNSLKGKKTSLVILEREGGLYCRKVELVTEFVLDYDNPLTYYIFTDESEEELISWDLLYVIELFLKEIEITAVVS